MREPEYSFRAFCRSGRRDDLRARGTTARLLPRGCACLTRRCAGRTEAQMRLSGGFTAHTSDRRLYPDRVGRESVKRAALIRYDRRIAQSRKRGHDAPARLLSGSRTKVPLCSAFRLRAAIRSRFTTVTRVGVRALTASGSLQRWRSPVMSAVFGFTAPAAGSLCIPLQPVNPMRLAVQIGRKRHVLGASYRHFSAGSWPDSGVSLTLEKGQTRLCPPCLYMARSASGIRVAVFSSRAGGFRLRRGRERQL